MSALWLVLISVILFTVAYITYGSFIARRLGVDPERKTPAHTLYDGVDYVPARAPVLLGHHFASIAGAAPIVGPIIAAAFGWIPVWLWVILGGIFIGAVHDFSSLIASVRHQGKSIGEVIEEQIGKVGKLLFLIFSWSSLILVIAVFTIIVSKTFEEVPAAATSSVLFIVLAVIFGLSIYRWKVKLGIATLGGVIFLAICLILGNLFPLSFSQSFWIYFLLAYVFVASVTPVWILLQPRDYLNSFLLYALVLGGVIGIIVVGPSLKLQPVTSFHVSGLGYLFPILFVTVACGAISGFHSLVASGTTAKQLNREPDAQKVGYAAMLIESLLAVVALTTAAILLNHDYLQLSKEKGPVYIFSSGLGGIFSRFGIPTQVGLNFAALAVSAFALTSLDTATRLARFAFQEFFEKKGTERQSLLTRNRFVGTAVTVLVAGILVLSGQGMKIWPVFGSANQLLAALALLAVSVWLSKLKRKNHFVQYPMFFMFAVTLSALITLSYQNFIKENFLLFTIACLLFIVAVVLAVQAYRSLHQT
ncbi:MAG: carbon starvation protein A [candidate division KSB1 bacterium]|nr:carbon starvation protein A [candidate division KSB1 bacterium]